MTTALTGWKKLRVPVSGYAGDPEGAVEARKEAEHVLAAEQAKQVDTAVVAGRMRQLRERNHFADLIAETMRKTT